MSDEPEFRWTAPPPLKRGGSKSGGSPITARQVDAMRSRPGEWLLIQHYSAKQKASNAATKLRRGAWPEIGDPAEWEITSRIPAEIAELREHLDAAELGCPSCDVHETCNQMVARNESLVAGLRDARERLIEHAVIRAALEVELVHLRAEHQAVRDREGAKLEPSELRHLQLGSKWFDVVDDLVGGAAVTTVNKPTSQIEPRNGEFVRR